MDNIRVATMLLMIHEIHECSSRVITPKKPNWIHNPCNAESNHMDYNDDGFRETAEMELKNFNKFISEKYKIISRGKDLGIEFGGSCPNITRTLHHLQNDTKVRVFYNMILRWAVFLHEIMVTIRDPDRQESYQKILINLKRLACEFRAILCRPRKKRPFKGFRSCFMAEWTHTKAYLFDLQILKRLHLFFTESAIILEGQLHDSCENDVGIYYI